MTVLGIVLVPHYSPRPWPPAAGHGSLACSQMSHVAHCYIFLVFFLFLWVTHEAGSPVTAGTVPVLLITTSFLPLSTVLRDVDMQQCGRMNKQVNKWIYDRDKPPSAGFVGGSLAPCTFSNHHTCHGSIGFGLVFCLYRYLWVPSTALRTW